MTKTHQTRLMAWRLKFLQRAAERPRSVAQTCRHFGISRRAFYNWKKRFEAHGAAGLCDQSRAAHHSPRATKAEVVSKILYLRERYHFGAGRIAEYLKRFHQIAIERRRHFSSCFFVPVLTESYRLRLTHDNRVVRPAF